MDGIIFRQLYPQAAPEYDVKQLYVCVCYGGFCEVALEFWLQLDAFYQASRVCEIDGKACLYLLYEQVEKMKTNEC